MKVTGLSFAKFVYADQRLKKLSARNFMKIGESSSRLYQVTDRLGNAQGPK